jgi:hypothetical protein
MDYDLTFSLYYTNTTGVASHEQRRAARSYTPSFLKKGLMVSRFVGVCCGQKLSRMVVHIIYLLLHISYLFVINSLSMSVK